jgi:hypothetical protein
MVTIRKRPAEGGTLYEVDDFPAYADLLRSRAIDPPPVRYGVVIVPETGSDMRSARDELEGQIALFFRLGPVSGISYRVVGT